MSSDCMSPEADWSSTYIAAQQAVERWTGHLSTSMDDRRIINTWIRYALTTDKAPDAAGMYFATFDKLPDHALPECRSVLSFIAQVHAVQNLQPLTQEQEMEVELLAATTYMIARSGFQAPLSHAQEEEIKVLVTETYNAVKRRLKSQARKGVFAKSVLVVAGIGLVVFLFVLLR